MAPELVELGRRHAVPHDLDEVVLKTLKHEADAFVTAFDSWFATCLEIEREGDLPTLMHRRDEITRNLNTGNVAELFTLTTRIVALTSQHPAVAQASQAFALFRRKSFDDLVRPSMAAFGSALEAGLQREIDRARAIEQEFLAAFGSGRVEGIGPVEEAVRRECADLLRVHETWKLQDEAISRMPGHLLVPHNLVELARKALEL
ncbi:MAG: hypothetical protein J0M24_10830 [Verrucomicrobia bacterium]|nr:hypothetical protein [Verrucomicrobiota bacterium]